MSSLPKLLIYEEQIIFPGREIFIDSTADNDNCVAFEDDGETGYFYALDRENDLAVLDALHIYNVADVINREESSELKIVWTSDYKKSFLLINNHYHAVLILTVELGTAEMLFLKLRVHG